MKRYIIPILIALASLSSCGRGDGDPRLVIITYDGLRWQEVFAGADSALIGNPEYVRDPEALKAMFWRDTPEGRREALMPFAWSHIASEGYMLGNRNKNSLMQVSNSKSFSYPGYSEMFCGWADDERVGSNDPVGNPNTSVLEVANRDPRYKGSVMVYGSWSSIRFAVNNERGGFPGSTAFEPNVSAHPSPALKMLDLVQSGLYDESVADERPDAITYGYAVETIRNDHPKVLFVSFGDTDIWPHDRAYDRYLQAVRCTDDFIRDIVETCESDPFYRGKTTYILTTDHGRGQGRHFTSHGSNVRGSDQTWLMAFGKGIPALGETGDNGPFFNRQIAATIAGILGLDFTPDNGVKSEPLDPSYFEPRDAPKPSVSCKAVKASPKGQGVRYTYHEGPFSSVRDVVASPVVARGIVPCFSLDGKKVEDHFGFVFETLLKIGEAGLYNLSISSDDGSKLYIDGGLLLDCDRNGGGFAEAWLELEEGFHRLKVEYFENYAGESLEVGLVGPGIEVLQLPPSMLYYE